VLIDWFTVAAQVVNFLILVWLLRRYLYKPILDAVDAREKRIAAELADADNRKAEAEKERDEFQRKNAQFDQQRAALMKTAADDANAERRRLMDEVREAASAAADRQAEALRAEREQLNQAIGRRAQQEIFAIARKTLADLATASLEERLGEAFTRRLRDLDESTKAAVIHALESTSDPALVRSAFELPPAQRSAIQRALNETFSRDVRVRFETSADLVAGIELTTLGYKVAWSIADYLATLEKRVGELLDEQTLPADTRREQAPTGTTE
jgi:F-type H+-transporting ATPase subunit b